MPYLPSPEEKAKNAAQKAKNAEATKINGYLERVDALITKQLSADYLDPESLSALLAIRKELKSFKK